MKQRQGWQYLSSIKIDSTLNQFVQKQLQNNKLEEKNLIICNVEKIYSKIQQNRRTNQQQERNQTDELILLEEIGKYMTSNKKQTMQFFRSSAWVSAALFICGVRTLQNNKCKQSKIVKEVYGCLIEGIVGVEEILQDFSLFKLYLVLFDLQATDALKASNNQQLVYFSSYINNLELLQKYLKSYQQQFEATRILFSIGSKLITDLDKKYLTQSKDLQQKDKKQLNIDNIQIDNIKIDKKLILKSNDLLKYYHIIIKYCLIDPQYKQILIQQIQQYFCCKQLYLDSIGQHHMIQIFNIIVQILNKKIYQDFDQRILHQLSLILDHLNDQNVKGFQQIFKIFLQNQNAFFLQQHQQQLIDFAVCSQLQTILFTTFYQYIKQNKNKQISKKLTNALICWNIELNLIQQKQFIKIIITLGLVNIKISSYNILNKYINNSSKDSHLDIYHQNDLFICQQPLKEELLNEDAMVYVYYAMEFIRYLTKIQGDKFRANPQTSINVVKNVDVVKKVYECAGKIRRKADQNKIYAEELLYYLCLLGSLVQSKRVIEIYKQDILSYYIKSIRSVRRNRVLNFSRELVSQFKIFKNAFTLFLILCGCYLSLQFSQQTLQQCLQILQDLIKILQCSNFAKICGYNQDVLKILLLLAFNTDQTLRNQCIKLISVFSSLYKATDINIILYQFDPQIFEPLLTMLGGKFPNTYTNTYFIIHTLDIIRNLLSVKNTSQCSSYLIRSDNCIHFIPIRHANHKNSLTLTFRALINPQFCCNSTVEIYGSLKQEESDVMLKHRIGFKNRKITFENRTMNEIIGQIDDLSDNFYAKSIQFFIEVVDTKLTVFVNDEKLIDMNYDYMLDFIRFNLNGDVMIKNFKWKKFQNSEKVLEFNESYQIFPSQAQIKIGRLELHNVKSFRQKLPLLQFCVYLLQILKNNHACLDLDAFYSTCFQLIYYVDGSDKNEYSTNQQSYIRQLFKTILKFAQKKIKISMPDLLIKKSGQQIQGKKLYQILLSTILDFNFMAQGTDQLKLQIYNYLKQLLIVKKPNIFRLTYECKQTKLFSNLCKLFPQLNDKIRQKYDKLITKLIICHEQNNYLLKKLYMMYSYSNNSLSLYSLFNACILQLFNDSSPKQLSKQARNDRRYHVQRLRKYIVQRQNDFTAIFMMVNQKVKIAILQFMINDKQLNLKWHQVFNNLHQNDIPQLSGWIIVECKKIMFQIFDFNLKSESSFKNIVFLLKQISKVYITLREQSERDECISILWMFLTKSSQQIKQSIKTEITVDIQNFYCSSQLIRVIENRIINFNRQGQKDLKKQKLVCCYFQFLFLHMPKFIILKALTQFRINKDCMKDNFKFILKFHCISEMFALKGFLLNVFLQYIIEVLVVLRNSENQDQKNQLAIQINDYIRKLLKYYPQVSTIKQPFFYVYPKLGREIQFYKENAVKEFTENVRKAKLYELRGGICFKLICIMFHLMEILPHIDFCDYLSLYLQIRENKAAQRAVYDFIQVRKQTKNRSYIDEVINKYQAEHRQYFFNNDEEIHNEKAFMDDNDLTPFYVDFILMKLFMYLENHCEKDKAKEEEIAIFKMYSEMAIKYLRSSEIVWDEMSEKNIESALYYENVSDFGYEEEIGQENGSKQIIERIVVEEYSTPEKPRRKQSLNIDLTTGKKKKQIFSNIESNIYRWSEEAKQKNLHRYFRDQAKQILLMELLHQAYVISSEVSVGKLSSKLKKNKKYINDNESLIEEGTTVEEVNFSNTNDRIRLVEKFTCNFVPKVKLNYHAFPNNTFPLVSTQEPENMRVDNSLPEAIGYSNVIITSLPLHLQEKTTTHTVVELFKPPQQQNQNICQISSREGVYFCEWQLSQKQSSIIFRTKNQKKAPNQKLQKLIKFGSPFCNIIAGKGKTIKLKTRQIYQIFYRKYNQIKNNSIQFFMKNGSSIYAVFYTEDLTNKFIQLCKQKFKGFKQIRIVQNFIKEFQNQNFTEKWVKGQITNFDYLMAINKYASRTFNDLNQYYVFPWILQQYKSESIELTNEKIFRDLRKPIGALNEKKLLKYKEKYNEKYLSEKYLYGSHYSTSLFLLYYLVRIQPYASLRTPFHNTDKQMQSGVFDSPDRLFSSLKQMWQCLMNESSTSDVKESIPQFYYFPMFLRNINNLDLGKKADGQKVNHVILPPWASSSTDFIHKMRICLQSDQVSMNLNYWIDLVFGKDQSQYKKDNLFHPYSYIENLPFQSLSKSQNLDAMMSQIAFYGQNPYVLFESQHPKKKLRSSNPLQNIDLYSSTRILKDSIDIRDLKQSRDLRDSKILMNTKDSNTTVAKENLQMINYVSDLKFKSKKIIQMTISVISKNSVPITIQLDMDKKLQSLIRTIQKRQSNNIKKVFSLNNIDFPQDKPSVTYKIYQNQITFSIGTHDVNQIVKIMRLSYSFTNIKFNQTILVLYGSQPGLRIYNWNQQIVWDYSSQLGLVSQCFLQYGLIFFATSSGKLFVYDFFTSINDMIFQYDKQTYELNMFICPKNKCITKKNEYEYKILLVADKRKIVIINYIHKIGKTIINNFLN